MNYARILCLLVCLGSLPATAHEFWIEPQDYLVNPSDKVIADIRNGQLFKGSSFSYVPDDYERFDFIIGETSQKMEASVGQRPAVDLEPVPEGLGIIVTQTTSSSLSYKDWAKFQKFINHKDFKITKADHLALGFPEEGFRETYRRFAKSIVGIGNAKGSDRFVGMEIELVALLNPYTDDTSGGMQVQAFYQGEPIKDVQIELFDKNENDEVEVTLHRTDADGKATLPIESGHSYLVDTVQLRPAPAGSGEGVVWETLWASLTYAKE